MQKETGRGLGLGAVDQIGYAVRDMERAVSRFEPLFGPFRVSEAALEDVLYRGVSTSCKLLIGVAQSGGLEIELIEVVEGETPHTEHLERHGEGLHHIRFRVDELDAKLEGLSKLGFETVFYKRFPGPARIAFAYAEAPQERGGGVIELLELETV